MKLRRAANLDLAILQHWNTKPYLIAASGDDGWFDWEAELPRQVPWRELLIAEDEGRPVGVFQVIDPAEEESHYWGDVAPNLRAIDIWIGEEFRGWGGVLIDPLWSNSRAQRFYERLGFRRVERRTIRPGRLHHVSARSRCLAAAQCASMKS